MRLGTDVLNFGGDDYFSLFSLLWLAGWRW